MIRVAGVIKPPHRRCSVLSAEDKGDWYRCFEGGTTREAGKRMQLDFALQVHDLGRYRGNACYVSGAIEANFSDRSLPRSPI